MDLENLELKAKKKKSKVIILIVVAIFSFVLMSFISYLLNVDNSKVYEKRKLDKMDKLEIIKNPEFKETWAIAMENRLAKQEERTKEIVDLVKNKQNSILTELKNIINENNKNINAQLSMIKETNKVKFDSLKKIIENQTEEQNARIEQLEKIKNTRFNNGYNSNGAGDNIVIGEDMLPSRRIVVNDNIEESNITKNTKGRDNNITVVNNDNNLSKEDKRIIEAVKRNPDLSKEDKINFTKSIEETYSSEEKVKPIDKVKPVVKSKKKKMVVVKIDTSFNMKLIKAQNKILKTQKIEKTTFKSYHISTGFTEAYMLTGAYAPVFQEGAMEPLPVLFETEGDILMSNNVSGNIGKCFLLGSAKGNMNSQTADIKLVSISCLINGGKARIEGSISGWVIGENGTPGLQGEMLHKNGAWLARTFVSGFFSTFSQALSGGQAQTINLGGNDSTNTDKTSTSSAINSNLLQAGASGISNVFSKLGDYYIKMAEQIFPVIEVKGGRTVNILLIGGEDLRVVENNKVDINDMTEDSEKIELQKEKKNGKINNVNAFRRVISDSANDIDGSSFVKDSLPNGIPNITDSSVEDIPEIIGGN